MDWELITRIIFYITALVFIGLLLWAIFGNSPTVEQLMIGGFFMFLGMIVHVQSQIVTLQVHAGITQNTLRKVGDPFDHMERKLNQIERKIDKLKINSNKK